MTAATLHAPHEMPDGQALRPSEPGEVAEREADLHRRPAAAKGIQPGKRRTVSTISRRAQSLHAKKSALRRICSLSRQRVVCVAPERRIGVLWFLPTISGCNRSRASSLSQGDTPLVRAYLTRTRAMQTELGSGDAHYAHRPDWRRILKRPGIFSCRDDSRRSQDLAVNRRVVSN
jgi:hypothetical protein